MVIDMDANILGVQEIKREGKSHLWLYRCMGVDRNKLPQTFDILTQKNGRKPGVQKMKVDVSSREGSRDVSFFEITE